MSNPPKPRFAFTKRRCYANAIVTHDELATFPSFRLAWDNAMNMFNDAQMTVCGVHYEPSIGCNPPHAEFMVVAGGEVEEYHIKPLD